MLRRQKSDVLSDLPPKIIQDYCCDLSPLQKMLYEDFAKTRAKKSIESSLETMGTGGEEKSEKIGHIFQVSLLHLRFVINFRQSNICKNYAIIRRLFSLDNIPSTRMLLGN